MTPIQSGPDIQNEVESFFANERPMPSCLDFAVEVTAAEIGHRNLMADFEKSFAAVFGAAMPSAPAVAPSASSPSVSPLSGFHPYRKENTNGE